MMNKYLMLLIVLKEEYRIYTGLDVNLTPRPTLNAIESNLKEVVE